MQAHLPADHEKSLERDIHEALNAGLDRRAWELAREAQTLYPANGMFAEWVRKLAPAQVQHRASQAVQGLSASMDWLEHHAAENRGFWLAVRHGELVARAQSRAQLDGLMGEMEHSDLLIDFVP